MNSRIRKIVNYVLPYGIILLKEKRKKKKLQKIRLERIAEFKKDKLTIIDYDYELSINKLVEKGLDE